VNISCHRIAWRPPFMSEQTTNRNRTDRQALVPGFSVKLSGKVLLSATYGYVEAYPGKTVPRVRIPLPPPFSLACGEFPLVSPTKLPSCAHLSRLWSTKRTAENGALRERQAFIWLFLWSRHKQSDFVKNDKAKLKRSQIDHLANADLTFSSSRLTARSFLQFPVNRCFSLKRRSRYSCNS